MPLSEPFSHCGTVTYMQFDISVAIKTIDSEHATHTETEQLTGSHLPTFTVLRVVTRVLQVGRDVDDSDAIPNLKAGLPFVDNPVYVFLWHQIPRYARDDRSGAQTPR
jgi:hypothetical protein